MSIERPGVASSRPLQHRGDALPAADALRGQRMAALLPRQQGRGLAGDARAGSTQRMADGQAAAVEQIAKEAVSRIRSGDPRDAGTDISPMVSARQWERVQSYIRVGLEEGATLMASVEGRPQGLDRAGS